MTSPFATALRSAIRASGLSLEGIVRRLAEKGSTITAGTLSHWQSDRTSPSRRDSLRAIGHLEDVLGLERDSLRNLVKPPHLRGRPTKESHMGPIAGTHANAERVRELVAQFDMSSDEKLMRISQHDQLRIGPDRAQESLVVKQILRATHEGPDRFVVVIWLDDDMPLPTLRAIRGCALGKCVTDETAHALVAELLFDHPLARGETVVTEHEFVNMTPPPLGDTDHYQRSFRYQIRECLVEVDFHPDALPLSCNEVFGEVGSQESATRRALAMDRAGRVHVVAVGFGPGDFGIEWRWPAN